jgi:hypothetical protein
LTAILPTKQEKIATFEAYSCPEFEITGVLYEGNRLFLHLDWPALHLTPSVYKKGLLAVAQIKRAAKDNGIPALYVLVPESLTKWEQMFGFHAIEAWSNKNPGGENIILMRQDTA